MQINIVQYSSFFGIQKLAQGLIFISIIFIIGCSSTVNSFKAIQEYGIVGDGKHDDTAGFQRVLNTKSEINLGKGVYRITSMLKIRKNGLLIKGENAQILFDGSPKEKLLWVEGSNVKFEGIIFNGNNKQVGASLLYIASISKSIKFFNCRFLNIRGTHQGGSNNYTNSQYAVMVSPTQVECIFNKCVFENISNDNSGKYMLPYVGGGFTGGVFFFYHDFKERQNNTLEGTKSVFINCRFKNIKTILGKNLDQARQIDWNDGDAIRTYSTKFQPLNLIVKDSEFIDISKRAIKFSGTIGGLIQNCIIKVLELDYPMVTAIQLSQGNIIENIQIIGLPEKPIHMAFQSQNTKNIILENINIDYCTILLNSAPSIASAIISNVVLNNIICNNCQAGIINSSFPIRVINVKVTNIEVRNKKGKKFYGFENFMASSSDNENYFQNIIIENGHMKLSGYNNTIKDININLDENCGEDVFLNRKCVLEAFGARGFKTNKEKVNSFSGFTLNINRVPKEYFKSRKALIYFYGDNTDYSNISFSVANNNIKVDQHVFISGNNLKISNLKYSGGGFIQIGTLTLQSKNIKVEEISRASQKQPTENIFIRIENVSHLNLDKVADQLKNNQPTIEINQSRNCNISNVKAATKSKEIIRKRNSVVLLNKIKHVNFFEKID